MRLSAAQYGLLGLMVGGRQLADPDYLTLLRSVMAFESLLAISDLGKWLPLGLPSCVLRAILL